MPPGKIFGKQLMGESTGQSCIRSQRIPRGINRFFLSANRPGGWCAGMAYMQPLTAEQRGIRSLLMGLISPIRGMSSSAIPQQDFSVTRFLLEKPTVGELPGQKLLQALRPTTTYILSAITLAIYQMVVAFIRRPMEDPPGKRTFFCKQIFLARYILQMPTMVGHAATTERL